MSSNKLKFRHSSATCLVVVLLILVLGSGGILQVSSPVSGAGLTLANSNPFASHSLNKESRSSEESNESNSSEEMPDVLRRSGGRQTRNALRSYHPIKLLCFISIPDPDRILISKSKRITVYFSCRDRLNGFGGNLLV